MKSLPCGVAHLVGMLSWTPKWHQNVLGSIPGQSAHLCSGFILGGELWGRQLTDISLLHPPLSLPTPLPFLSSLRSIIKYSCVRTENLNVVYYNMWIAVFSGWGNLCIDKFNDTRVLLGQVKQGGGGRPRTLKAHAVTKGCSGINNWYKYAYIWVGSSKVIPLLMS